MPMLAHDALFGRQAFAERRFSEAWSPSRFDLTRAARMRALLAALAPAPRRVLDVGCYDGQLAAHVVPPAARVVGLDVATDALRRARARGLAVARAQVEGGLPFSSGAFDAVIAAEVIEHVFDTQALTDELARVVRPGGHVLVTTPNLVALSGRAKLLLGQSPANVEFDAAPSTSGHVRYLTFDTLEVLLRRAGLEPLGRWTNGVHFSRFGSNEAVGRLAPGLGHTLIGLARRPA